MFLSSLDMNLLAFYHKYRSLIGYASHYYSVIDSVCSLADECALVNKMMVASWHFRSVCEKDLDKVLNE